MTIDRTVTVNVTLTHDEVIQAILRFVKDRIDADIEQANVTVYDVFREKLLMRRAG